MNSSELAISVRHLTKSFGGKPAVEGFSLDVSRGTIFGFLGPNGSGKTTTIRMLCGLLRPNDGGGSCLGFDIATQTDEIKKRVGYMTQRFGLYGEMTVQENLEFIGRMYDVPKLKARVAEIIEQFNFGALRDTRAEQLSGGWKQRLSLASCVLHRPELLLLDEPTAGVDPHTRREFWEMLHSLATQGTTILVSTHYMDEAERCHRIAYLAAGRLLLEGTVDEVVAQSGLTTWAASGPNSVALEAALKQLPGIEMVAAFGNTLHISGTDTKALDEALAPFRRDSAYRWARIPPTLEDVFIHTLTSEQDRRP